MKKLFAPLAFLFFAFGFISCEADNLAETDSLYDRGTDGDIVIIDTRDGDEDGTDGDDVPIDTRDENGN